MNMEEEKRIAQVRADIYTLLSQCFMQPSIELVNSIIDGSLIHALEDTIGLTEDICVKERLAKLRDLSTKCQNFSAMQILKDMKAEYSRLFVGPGHVLAPPYESVYKTKNSDNKMGIVMGDSTIEVKHFYGRAGLKLSEDFTDLPDHITLELHFMGYLCTMESDKIQSDKMQADFLKIHIGSWISDFSKAITMSTNSVFYHEVAELTEAWIKLEVNELVD